MKGEDSAKARVTFKRRGEPRSQAFEGLASALDFSVRLRQSYAEGEVTDITIRDADGQVAFSDEEIERLSALVRLSGSPRKASD